MILPTKKLLSPLRIGPFSYRIYSGLPPVQAALSTLYAHATPLPPDAWCDFHLALEPHRFSLRHWFRTRADVLVDGMPRFSALKPCEWVPYLEWGLNSCIALDAADRFLLLHAATLATPQGDGLIILGPAGSGKSSLAAWLVADGWRLLSDEFAAIDLESGLMLGLERPLCLKNHQIELFRARVGDDCGVFGPEGFAVRKGRLRHWTPPTVMRQTAATPVQPRWLIIPQRTPDQSELRLDSLDKGLAMQLGINGAFNYRRLGEPGFNTLTNLIETCQCHTLTFQHAEQVPAWLRDSL